MAEMLRRPRAITPQFIGPSSFVFAILILLIRAFNCVEAGDIFRHWIADSVGWRKL
jgi:hypothetical protein